MTEAYLPPGPPCTGPYVRRRTVFAEQFFYKCYS